MKTEVKMVVVRNEEQRGLESYCLIGTEFLFGKMKNVLEMDGGDSFIMMWMYIFTYIHLLIRLLLEFRSGQHAVKKMEINQTWSSERGHGDEWTWIHIMETMTESLSSQAVCLGIPVLWIVYSCAWRWIVQSLSMIWNHWRLYTSQVWPRQP